MRKENFFKFLKMTSACQSSRYVEKKRITKKLHLNFDIFLFPAPAFIFIFYLLQPHMHSAKYSARGVHAAYHKKKKKKMYCSSVAVGFMALSCVIQ